MAAGVNSGLKEVVGGRYLREGLLSSGVLLLELLCSIVPRARDLSGEHG
jgi:hypothetical protein